jgi:hypothetical protein
MQEVLSPQIISVTSSRGRSISGKEVVRELVQDGMPSRGSAEIDYRALEMMIW